MGSCVSMCVQQNEFFEYEMDFEKGYVKMSENIYLKIIIKCAG